MRYGFGTFTICFMVQKRETDGDLPLYQHQLEAILARRRFLDQEAIGAFHRCGLRSLQKSDVSGSTSRKGKPISTPRAGFDLCIPSPLIKRDRQSSAKRIPHFDIKTITAQEQPSKAGRTQHGSKQGSMTGSEHFNYVRSGAYLTISSHLDYLRRQHDCESPGQSLDVDMLDEQVVRAEQNALAYFTNIPGDVARQRSLFEAAERIDAKPKTFYLKASTAKLAYLKQLAVQRDAPDWFFPMLEQLRKAKQDADETARNCRKEQWDYHAQIASGSAEQVYDWLSDLEAYPDLKAEVEWEQGRAGRSQIRFVGELPQGLSPSERHQILTMFCGTLAADGMMVAAAIHQPDRTNDKRNFHIHVDAYDRPAQWLEEHDCWDFEHCVRKNGKNTYPLRQRKVRYPGQSAIIFRQRFIDIVNQVRAGRKEIAEYLPGTYAENGVELTPLEHMGSRAIGLEKRGAIT
ncbi:hypothetical protein A9995_07020 [Erythrobacter sp. QSSC1-22B]|uniref:MobA/MobL family protein n=1 Tax=Erythrobacter sp. QSSC1-22B TaxID=1860125 RepID=UPI0008049266|nr:MobA/MobL family protein [Erythrobacter sp. QSSC1-22B]OBX19495.1 hypothetical protein A9995_07020 [Erythrobacter sp. QSSC1-22B]